MYRRVVLLGLAIMLAVSWQGPVRADSTPSQSGLTVSPTKLEFDVRAGQTKSGGLQISNNSPDDMPVDLELKSLSVEKSSYSYRFEDLRYNWINLNTAHLSFTPGQKETVQYDLSVPLDTPSGGYYFVLIARTRTIVNGVRSTLQVAVPFMVTVVGKDKIYSESNMSDIQIPFVVFGDKFPYKFDVDNGGNVHLNGEFVVRVDSLWGGYSQQEEKHIVFPKTARLISGEYTTPLWPGLYQLTYGYIDKDTDNMKASPVYFVVLPPWLAITLVAALLLYLNHKFQKRKRRAR